MGIIPDGDSKAFKALKEMKLYGENFEPEKKECIAHVQKRVGTKYRDAKKVALPVNDKKPLKRLKSKNQKSSEKQENWKMLKNSDIDRIQKYYRKNIISNATWQGMQKD